MRKEELLKKIGIFVCGEVSKNCIGTGCLRTFNERKDSFEHLNDQEVILAGFNNCIGCGEKYNRDKSGLEKVKNPDDYNFPLKALDKKIQKFKTAGVTEIHVSTCIRGRCANYENFCEAFSKEFSVVGYTHGQKISRKGNIATYFKEFGHNKVMIGPEDTKIKVL